MNNLKKRFDNYVGEAPRFTVSLEDKIMKEISTSKKRNNGNKLSNNLRLSLFFVVFISVATVFIMSVVTNSDSIDYANPIIDPDPKSFIQEVLELQFDGVDKKLNEFLEPQYRIVKDGKEELPEFEKYIDETYGPYFTKDGLDVFMRTFGTQYPILAYEFGYQLDLKDVKIEQHETTPNRYNFTAKVGYQKDGSKEEIAEVNGIVLFSTKEEGKIGKFVYADDSGLADLLNESNDYQDEENLTDEDHTVIENDTTLERELLEEAADILSSLKSHNWDEISEMAHPDGVAFSLFADFGSPTSNEVVLSKEDIKDNDQGEIIWGVELSGEKVMNTKDEYVDEYLFKNIFGDSVNYDTVNFNSSSVESGGVINTISTYFPDAKYVEYYSKPTEKEIDWQALRFVFKEHEREWLLFGIARDVHNP